MLVAFTHRLVKDGEDALPEELSATTESNDAAESPRPLQEEAQANVAPCRYPVAGHRFVLTCGPSWPLISLQ